MEPATYGIVSIVPVIVLIVVALITKRTFESLLIATLLALVLGYKGDWFYALIEQIQTVSADNVWVLLVVGLLGGLVGVLEKSRAAMGFTGVLSRFATYKKRSLLAEWALSVVLFVDDYLNILATGSITKRLNDSHRIHRTMTAYVIGSTSAPVVGVAITTETVVPGCATGATQAVDVETTARFALEVAKSFGRGNCRFYDEQEFAMLQEKYGSMSHVQTMGK